MRAYRKTATRHPFCVYLTAEEANELLIETEIAAGLSDDVPEIVKLMLKLDALFSDPQRERA